MTVDPSRMLRDVEYISAKLGKIDGFGSSGKFLAETIGAKAVEESSPPSAHEQVGKDAGSETKHSTGE